ncbi:MAG: CBS domain-containing protein [Gemmatimonadetes bacterium]|nr:CBS domain-containing protein [Gemmatimonadota bacterium]
MTTEVVTATPETLVADIAKRLIERRISALPVVDAKGQVVGIVSEGDLMRRPETGAGSHSSLNRADRSDRIAAGGPVSGKCRRRISPS